MRYSKKGIDYGMIVAAVGGGLTIAALLILGGKYIAEGLLR